MKRSPDVSPADAPVFARRLRSKRLAVSLVFFVNGAVFASWVPHIPLIQARLDLGDGGLGLALLCLAAGAVAALVASGRLIARFGSRTVTRAAGLCFCAALPMPILAPSPLALALALAFFGAANGAMDVAMNDQAVIVEKARRAPIMSSFHGFFSLGGLFGAALGGAALAAGVSPMAHILCAVAFFGLLGLYGLIHLVPSAPEEDATMPKSHFGLPHRAIWPLCFLAFLTLACEGAMADWTSVYLKNVLAAGAGPAAWGYAAFSLAMAAGRFGGDRLAKLFGPVTLVRTSAMAAFAGLVLAVAATGPALAILGFALVGLGLSNVVPLLFSAAGRTPGVATGAGIAGTAAVGYLGFLAGPPCIGFVAEVSSLRVSLAGLALCAALLAAMAGRVERPALADDGGAMKTRKKVVGRPANAGPS